MPACVVKMAYEILTGRRLQWTQNHDGLNITIYAMNMPLKYTVIPLLLRLFGYICVFIHWLFLYLTAPF